MRVGILVKEFPPDVIGGTETQTFRLATELERRDDKEVTVYTKAYPGTEPHSNVEFELVRVPNWHYSPFTSTLTFVLFAFVYLLRDRHRIDVLQCMMIYPTGYVGYLTSLLTSTPYFAWIRGGDYYFMKEQPVKRWLIDSVFRDTTVLVQTERICRDVRNEFPDATIEVVGNGVDLPDHRANGNKIVFVGRLKEQKGVHVLLQALKGFNKEVLIVGDGPERDQLRELAASMEIGTEFAGEVPPQRVTDYLRQGKVFVLPAVRGEGLPNAILEAMAVGLPVVATEIAGIPDVVQDGTNGFVVPPGDERALREAIQCLCSDAELRERMGTAARHYVEQHHAWPRILDQLEEVYESVVASGK